MLKIPAALFVSMGGYPPYPLPKTRQRAEIRQILSYRIWRIFPTRLDKTGFCTRFVQSGPCLAKSGARVADRAARNNKSLQVQEGSRFRYQPSRMEWRRCDALEELCNDDSSATVQISVCASNRSDCYRYLAGPGQGIGLAVVKDIIESYDAQLTLEDSPLGGAAFRIHFSTV